MTAFIDAEIINQKLAERATYFDSLTKEERGPEMIKEIADELTQLNAILQLIAANVGRA